MSIRRQIACCLGFLSAGCLLLGCGSGDGTSAEIDPVIASELSVQLDRIEGFFDVGNCDRATGAVDTLEAAIEARSGQTGEQFTADAQELVGNLREKVEDECEPDETSTSTTTDVETTPTTTTDDETTTTTTTDETTTTDDDETTTPDPPTAPVPPTDPGNGNGNGPPDNPGGGITPGKQGAGR